MGWCGGCLAEGLVHGAVPTIALASNIPTGVCAALAAGQNGAAGAASLRPLLLAVSPSRPSRCLERVAPSGCPFSLPAGTPLSEVCAFRELGPVALLVRAGCPLGVCVRASLRCSRLPPFLCLVARAPGEVPWQDAGRAVAGAS